MKRPRLDWRDDRPQIRNAAMEFPLRAGRKNMPLFSPDPLCPLYCLNAGQYRDETYPEGNVSRGGNIFTHAEPQRPQREKSVSFFSAVSAALREKLMQSAQCQNGKI
jgi:hypothetical protein